MKKVLFSAHVDSHILAFHIPYLKYFKEQGYEVHVATNGTETIPYCDKKILIPFERNPLKINNLKAIKQLKKVINEEKYDIIHTHTPMGGVVTRLAAKQSRKKNNTRVIYTAHGFHFYKGAPKKYWLMFYPVEKYLAKYTDDLITINKEDYNLAKTKFKTKVHYVPGVGIDDEKFGFKMTEKEKQDLRKSLGLKKDDFVMIYPAEISVRKNQEWLINTLEKTIKENNDIHLLLPGKDSLNGKIQKQIKQLKLEKNIHLLGFRKDIPKLLKIANLAVSSSRQEGLPVNIMEAMYEGLPIVATACRGNSDLIEDGVNGFVIEQNDENDFRKSVKVIYSNKVNTNKIKDENNKKIKEYLLDNVLKQMKVIYGIEKKKIMFYTMSMQKGGAERVIANISNHLHDKYDITIVTNINSNSYYELNSSIKHIKIDANKQYNNLLSKLFKKISIVRSMKLKKIVKKERPNIIISFLPEPSFRILRLSKKINTPIIISDRNDPNIEYSNFIISKMMRKLYPKANGFVFQTENAKNYFNDIIDCKTKIIGNPLSNDFIVKPYQGKRKKTIVTVGRLEEQKNHKLLIDSFNKIHEKYPEYKLLIYGDGNKKNEIKNYIKSLNLEQCIELKGITNNVKKAIYDAGIFVLSSKYEGMPNALMEAMSLGIPCISTDCPCGGPKTLIKNRINGLLVPVNDENEMAKSICELIENNELAINISKNAIKIQKELTIDQICKQWEKFIEQFL